MSLPTRSGWSPSRENAIRSVERRGTTLQHLGGFRDDEGVVRAAVSCDGRALPFAQDGHYMIQPLVELHGGCMAVLKVS
jgi:hypothetical protein